MSGIQFSQGEVVMVPMPFTDLKGEKTRPALIISGNEHNSDVEDVVVCGITSNLRDEDYSIIISEKDMADGKLPFVSRIKVNKIFTLHKATIRKTLGRVQKAVLDSVKTEIVKLIA